MLRDRTVESEAGDGAVSLRYEPDAATFLALAEWITLERLCCPRFGFRLVQEPDGGPVRVLVEGAGVEHLAPGRPGEPP